MFPIAIGAIALLGIITVLSLKGGDAHAASTPAYDKQAPKYASPSTNPLIAAAILKLNNGEYISIDELRDAMQAAYLDGLEETAEVFYGIILKRGGEPNPATSAAQIEALASKED